MVQHTTERHKTRPPRWRSLLFTPGDRDDRLIAAHTRGADAVIIDLEDAVTARAKGDARAAVAEFLRQVPANRTYMVRINGPETPWFIDDLRALEPVLDRLTAVVIPKASSADEVRQVDKLLRESSTRLGVEHSVWVIPIVETAAGVLTARAIAEASERNATLMFGPADLSTELGIEMASDSDELRLARSLVVLAAAAAGLGQPIDGAYLTLGDPQGLERSVRSARLQGFAGKAVIHPEQISVVNSVFEPDPHELGWARKVLTAFERATKAGDGAIRLDDGAFVDEAVVKRARALLDDAQNQNGRS